MIRPRTISTATFVFSFFSSSAAFSQTPVAPGTSPPAVEPAASAPAAPAPAPAPAEQGGAPTAEAPVETTATSETAPATVPDSPPAMMKEEAPAPATTPMVEPVVAPEAPPAAEPSLLPFKVGTSMFSRLEVRENYDRLGVSRGRFVEGDQTVFRARLSLETSPLKLTDGLEGLVYVAPQASGQWGTSGLGGTIGEANVGFYEGYFALRGKSAEVKVGRFAMDYGDSLVIGNLDWHQSGRAFDGLHVRTKMSKITVDFFATQTTEGHPLAPEPLLVGDTYFYGAYAMVGPAVSETLALDFYALGLSTGPKDVVDAGGGLYHVDTATLATLGGRVKQKVSMFDYKLEAGLQMGTTAGTPPAGAPAAPAGATGDTLETFAYHADAEIGVSPIKEFRLALGGALASGNDPTTTDKMEGWNELFPTGHKFLGLMDVIGPRTNVASGIFIVQADVTPSTKLSLDSHLFARVEDGGLGRVPGSDAFAGVELNAQALQKFGKWAYARGLYGAFIPGAGHYLEDVTAHYVEIQAGLKY